MSTLFLPRSSGILLHPTSLPGAFGIGDLGPVAYRWVETLSAMKQSWWQILPLGPTGAGDSPYQSFSAFAGNINLLSPELLQQDGLVSPELWAGEQFSNDWVEYERITPFKTKLLRAAWNSFQSGKSQWLQHDFQNYCNAEASWLNDYALFMAIRESLGGAGLTAWPPDLLRRNPVALTALEKELAAEVQMHKFGQFLFDRQWSSLRKFAAERKVQIIGDAPIFVALDSADVWANPDQFLLDADRKPIVVAGVPPDYFSEDGQHWGNPIYDWARMETTGFAWWCARLLRQLKQVDLIRLDHFRGFAQAWHIPAGEKTARNGKWIDGPGLKLFERLRTAIGGLPIIAEDLGLITPDVEELRDTLGLPGMRVIEFALDSPNNPHWPHNYATNCVSYTGTHDNDTVNGWYATLNEYGRNFLAQTLGRPVSDPAWDLLRLAWSSVAVVAVAPLQDVLSMGSEARMNRPGIADGNWRWRFRLDQFRQDAIPRLAELTTIYNRIPPNIV
ncbi:MAG: 4-alpha-glucanotransferase [Planctomycetia bacterium]|nr:4-alpha-glucanotransferase [Planctomycetia bacterium]